MLAPLILQLLLVVGSFGVPIGMVAWLLLWARWLQRRTAAPSKASRVARAMLLVGVLTTGLGGPIVGFATARFATQPQDDPSQKARLLAESISDAMNCGALAFLTTLALTTAWLLYATLRWHWLAGPDAAKGEPPYR